MPTYATTATFDLSIDEIVEEAFERCGIQDRSGRSTYLNYTVKTSGGRPTQYYFEKTINPTLYLYPAADVAYTVVFYAMLRMKDSGAYTNNNEIPFSFLPCLTAGLAYYIALKYAPERTQILKIVYEEEFRRAADTNRGNVSSHFVPKVGITAGTY